MKMRFITLFEGPIKFRGNINASLIDVELGEEGVIAWYSDGSSCKMATVSDSTKIPPLGYNYSKISVSGQIKGIHRSDLLHQILPGAIFRRHLFGQSYVICNERGVALGHEEIIDDRELLMSLNLSNPIVGSNGMVMKEDIVSDLKGGVNSNFVEAFYSLSEENRSFWIDQVGGQFDIRNIVVFMEDLELSNPRLKGMIFDIDSYSISIDDLEELFDKCVLYDQDTCITSWNSFLNSLAYGVLSIEKPDSNTFSYRNKWDIEDQDDVSYRVPRTPMDCKALLTLSEVDTLECDYDLLVFLQSSSEIDVVIKGFSQLGPMEYSGPIRDHNVPFITSISSNSPLNTIPLSRPAYLCSETSLYKKFLSALNDFAGKNHMISDYNVVHKWRVISSVDDTVEHLLFDVFKGAFYYYSGVATDQDEMKAKSVVRYLQLGNKNSVFSDEHLVTDFFSKVCAIPSFPLVFPDIEPEEDEDFEGVYTSGELTSDSDDIDDYDPYEIDRLEGLTSQWVNDHGAEDPLEFVQDPDVKGTNMKAIEMASILREMNEVFQKHFPRERGRKVNCCLSSLENLRNCRESCDEYSPHTTIPPNDGMSSHISPCDSEVF